MPCAMSDRTTASPPLISGMGCSPPVASLRGPRSGPKQSPAVGRRLLRFARNDACEFVSGWDLIRLDLEWPLERREPGVEDLRRFARGFEVEQRAVDEIGETRLVLLQAEAGRARQ